MELLRNLKFERHQRHCIRLRETQFGKPLKNVWRKRRKLYLVGIADFVVPQLKADAAPRLAMVVEAYAEGLHDILCRYAIGGCGALDVHRASKVVPPFGK